MKLSLATLMIAFLVPIGLQAGAMAQASIHPVAKKANTHKAERHKHSHAKRHKAVKHNAG